jgi:hypothetical protein
MIKFYSALISNKNQLLYIYNFGNLYILNLYFVIGCHILIVGLFLYSILMCVIFILNLFLNLLTLMRLMLLGALLIYMVIIIIFYIFG